MTNQKDDSRENTDRAGEAEANSTSAPSSLENLEPAARRRIEVELESYKQNLRTEYRRDGDSGIIRTKESQLLETLIDRETADESRDLDDIRAEEHANISTNMILSMASMVLFVGWALLAGDDLERRATAISTFFVQNLGWFYILISSGFLVYLTYMACSRFGNVVLGDPGEQPEFSMISWCAMLFSAGMGVGLLFWGGAEPLTHLLTPPAGVTMSPEAARQAFVLCAFHWGLHGWGVYTVCALGVAYYGFRKRKKYLVSSSVMDVFDNQRVNNVLKVIADYTATMATIFGMAASVGMGVIQFSGGLKYIYGLDSAESVTGRTIIMLLITVCFLISACTGLEKGIKFMSNMNMLMAIVLMLFVFLCGPSLFCLKIFVDSIGQYVSQILSLSFKLAPFTPAYEQWMRTWTLSYFSWWIAWAPFVGIFIARISRGRTIRQLILGSLILPTTFSMIWFSIFGGCAIHLELFTRHGVGQIALRDAEEATFAILSHLPMAGPTSILALALIFTFLVTSADSATYVISMMTTEGDLDPSTLTKLIWGSTLSLATLILVNAGGIKALKSVSLVAAFPFSLILVLITFSVYVRLSTHVKQNRI